MMEKGGSSLKRLLFAVMFLASVMIASLPAMAQVDIDVGAGSPVTSEYLDAPSVTSEQLDAPDVTSEYLEAPDVIPLPETDNVYVVPDLDIDVFFWNGWWWRPWQGGWYRSRYYSSGWGHYGAIPTFYYDVDPGWRGYYRDRNWYGNPWHYERIDYRHLHLNWKQWHDDQHWERQRMWGVQGYQPRPQQQRQELRQQREREYYQRSDVQQYQQQLRQQQLDQQQQYQQQRQQSLERVKRPQKQEQRPRVQQQQRRPKVKQQQHPRPQEKPQAEEGDHRK